MDTADMEYRGDVSVVLSKSRANQHLLKAESEIKNGQVVIVFKNCSLGK